MTVDHGEPERRHIPKQETGYSRKREDMIAKQLLVKLAEQKEHNRTKGRELTMASSSTWPLFSEPWGFLTKRPEPTFGKYVVWGLN